MATARFETRVPGIAMTTMAIHGVEKKRHGVDSSEKRSSPLELQGACNFGFCMFKFQKLFHGVSCIAEHHSRMHNIPNTCMTRMTHMILG